MTNELNVKIEAAVEEAVEEARAVAVAEEPMLKWFSFTHLPPHMRATSCSFAQLAVQCVVDLPRCAERTVALRKLLEAKDAAVRARMEAP